MNISEPASLANFFPFSLFVFSFFFLAHAPGNVLFWLNNAWFIDHWAHEKPFVCSSHMSGSLIICVSGLHVAPLAYATSAEGIRRSERVNSSLRVREPRGLRQSSRVACVARARCSLLRGRWSPKWRERHAEIFTAEARRSSCATSLSPWLLPLTRCPLSRVFLRRSSGPSGSGFGGFHQSQRLRHGKLVSSSASPLAGNSTHP